MSMYDRINAGEFSNPIAYPVRPAKPSLLSKRASELTSDEIAHLSRAKADYEAAVLADKAEKLKFSDGEKDAIERFWVAVAEECGVDRKDPFVSKMEAMAWDRGHSAGYCDVFSEFTDLMDLYELYARKQEKKSK